MRKETSLKSHFLTQVFGVENLATADPENSFNVNDGKYHSDFSYVCRFALGVAIYAAVSLGQVRQNISEL